MIYYTGDFRWKEEHFNTINKHPVVSKDKGSLLDYNIIFNIHYIRTFKLKYEKEYECINHWLNNTPNIFHYLSGIARPKTGRVYTNEDFNYVMNILDNLYHYHKMVEENYKIGIINNMCKV